MKRLSDYWLQNPNPDLNNLFDLLKLQQAVANFVKIVADKEIPVEFKVSSNDKSTKDKIIISADLANIDATVGLAIHETLVFSHSPSWITSRLIGLINNDYVRSFVPNIEQKMLNRAIVRFIEEIKMIYSLLEYWRIDDLAIRIAPGYKGYVAECYRRFFNPDETIEIFNMLQIAFCSIFIGDRDKPRLKGIPKITWNDAVFAVASQVVYSSNYQNVCKVPIEPNQKLFEKTREKLVEKTHDDWSSSTLISPYLLHEMLKPIIDIDNISRLKSSEDCLHLAVEVWENITKVQSRQPIIMEYDNGKTDNPEKFETSEYNNVVARILQSANLEMEKKTISVSHREELKSLLYENSSQNTVLYDNRRIPVVLISGLNRDKVLDGKYSFFSEEVRHQNEEAITEGIRLGKQLARRILFRNNERKTRFSHLKRGKIDNRLIHSIAYGNDEIFYRQKEETFPAVNFHISIDGSHSMQGNCFLQSLKTAVAIAQASDLVRNINVCISFRFHEKTKHETLPLLLIAYDSRKDKMNQIKHFFPYLNATGPTAEGLCYPIITEYIEKTAGEKSENYFINFYDGMPLFVIEENCTYEGKPAMMHIRDEVLRMKRRGIKVLSYYIVSKKWRTEEIKRTFSNCQYMYGKDAKMININDLSELAQSLNRLISG